MTKSSHATQRELIASLKRQAARTGAATPTVRGADWRLATVTAIGAGTVTADGITARRLEEAYSNPIIGDVIVISQSSSGNWIAWGRLAGDSDGLGTVLFKRKTANTGPRTSITSSADPHLSVTLAAGGTYTLDAFVKWSGDPASDMAWGWNVPADAAGSWVCYADATSLAGLPSTVRNIDTGIGSPRSYGALEDTVTGHAMRGTVRTTAGGTFSANWGSQTAGGAGVTCYADSWIRLERTE